MTHIARWTPTGRWSDDGLRCYALMGTLKQAQWGDRLIFGRRSGSELAPKAWYLPDNMPIPTGA